MIFILSLLIAFAPPISDPATLKERSDTNGDGAVNTSDLLIVIGNWSGTTPPPVIVPPVPLPVPSTTITWTGADGQPKSITPVQATNPIVMNGGINATGMKDKTWTGNVAVTSYRSKVFTTEGDGGGADNLRVQNLIGTYPASGYGAWIGGGGDYTFDNVQLTCTGVAGSGDESYGIRSYCDHLTVLNSKIDNSKSGQEGKRTIRIPQCDSAAIVNTKLIGGAIELGQADASGNTNATAILFRGGGITKKSDPMNCCVRLLNGAGDVVFEDYEFTDGGTATDIQGTFTGRVAYRRCTRAGVPLTKSHIGNDMKVPGTNNTDWSHVTITN